jgi:long-chain acyl-CoA synthetase
VSSRGERNGSSKRKSNGSAKSSNGSGDHAGGAGPTLDLDATFEGRRLVVVGGTGFLGKVWWSFLLARFPKVEHL